MTIDFRGEQLRSARLFHGLTLEELGDKVGSSKQYIQRLEINSTYPRHGMIKALAETLLVTPAFFDLNDHTLISEESCHFRKLKTTPRHIERQAWNYAHLFQRLVRYLDEVLTLPSVNLPAISKEMEIEQIAEKCRQHWGLGIQTPILNMTRVLERAGIFVSHFSQVSEKIDAFSIGCKRPLVIRNPSKPSVCRMRFDLAHELGHLVMHQGIETGDDQTENEANRFASAFLLPRVAFLQEFSFLEKDRYISWQKLYRLKLRWRTSVLAMIRRAYDLGMIDSKRYQHANIYLNKSGQSKQEKFDEEVTGEKAEVIHHCLQLLRTQPLKYEGLLSHLKIQSEMLKKLVSDFEFQEGDFERNFSNVIPITFNKRK